MPKTDESTFLKIVATLFAFYTYHELIGRVPGLIISPDGKILIRGISSVNSSNEPLIIVDRIAVPDINVYRPNEVEKVEVLKDASSAIYGVRGANGVILITLKHY